MTSDVVPNVTALAINVTIPESSRWTDSRRGEEFALTTLNVKTSQTAASRQATADPSADGRGFISVSFPVPDTPELATLINSAASRAAALWAAHRGLS